MYLVTCNDKRDGEVIMQRTVADAESFEQTVASLAAGEWEDVVRVIRTTDGQDVLPLMRTWIDRNIPFDDETDYASLRADSARDHKRALMKETA